MKDKKMKLKLLFFIFLFIITIQSSINKSTLLINKAVLVINYNLKPLEITIPENSLFFEYQIIKDKEYFSFHKPIISSITSKQCKNLYYQTSFLEHFYLTAESFSIYFEKSSISSKSFTKISNNYEMSFVVNSEKDLYELRFTTIDDKYNNVIGSKLVELLK